MAWSGMAKKSTYSPDAQRDYRKREIGQGREEFLMKLDGTDAIRLRGLMARFGIKTRQGVVRFALENLATGDNNPPRPPKPKKARKAK